jgi:hydrogenase 3 maturation protease
MCIGNIDGGDDGVGPYIAGHLKQDFNVIDCGIIPENYTSIVKKEKPDTLIIIDAVEMGLEPGSLRIVPEEKIGVMHISTHGIPLSVLIGYLKNYVNNIILIGVQPKNMSGGLSKIVKKNADKLIEILRKKNLDEIEKLE